MICIDRHMGQLDEKASARATSGAHSKGEKKQARAAADFLFLTPSSSFSPPPPPLSLSLSTSLLFSQTNQTTDPAPLVGRHRQDGRPQGARALRPGLVLHPGRLARPQGVHAPGMSFFPGFLFSFLLFLSRCFSIAHFFFRRWHRRMRQICTLAVVISGGENKKMNLCSFSRLKTKRRKNLTPKLPFHLHHSTTGPRRRRAPPLVRRPRQVPRLRPGEARPRRRRPRPPHPAAARVDRHRREVVGRLEKGPAHHAAGPARPRPDRGPLPEGRQARVWCAAGASRRGRGGRRVEKEREGREKKER